ncbi:conserved exported hypothetical protein [Candidatus Nitrotoga sp. HW29]|uniref:DUF3108 domain-containing protein n=1 Tax=Candidatus Nitrotoga sp. HW29 TaxID=2886963 RepID=UPI001EF3CE00|nr:DUF3108 domain-containing protein [Candidatus Nitrotoga sp. HW29]CAH1905084.1 conserved exported hypothetical protein [Candidatus Nitrotoga sp. HW29]
MRNIIYLASLLLLASIVPQALFAATPSVPAHFTNIDAHYDVLKGNIKVATMTETYARTQGGYRIESITKAIGLLAMFKPEIIRVTSEGTLTAKGLRPLTYIQERKLDTDRNTRADFDWKAKNITLTDRAGKRTLPLSTGTQDRLSAMYQFMFAPLQNATELNFNMTNGSKVDEYSYRLTPDQSMTISFGTFKALYVASPPQDGENQTELWLATEHGNFPYKMIITESGGDKFTQVLTKINFE